MATTVSLVGAAGAKPMWQPPSPPVEEITAAAAAELAAEIRARDVRAITARLATPVTNHGLWFPDRPCAARFATPGVIAAKDRSAFAACLGKLKLQLSTRRSAQRNGAVLTAEPGIELELGFSGSQLHAVGFPLYGDDDAGIPLLDVQAFEALRTHGTTLLDAIVGDALEPELATQPAVSTWLKVCVDATGQVIRATPNAPTTRRTGEVFANAALTWQFRPFTHGGRARPVCSLSLLTYPSAKATAVEVLPPSGHPSPVVRTTTTYDFGDDLISGSFPNPPLAKRPPTRTISPAVLERLRIAGKNRVDPDAATQRAILAAGQLTALAQVKLCVDPVGHVTSVTIAKPSGYAAWDRRITTEVRRWRFKPYLVKRVATPACTAMTFVFNPDPTKLAP